MELSLDNWLILHTALIGFVLLMAGLALHRNGLFGWTKAGFWAWAASLLYFFLHPLVSLLRGDTYIYKIRLEIAGGVERGIWILVIVVLGIGLFSFAYIRTKCNLITWKLHPSNDDISIKQGLALSPFVLFGVYSMVVFRAQLFSSQVSIEGGRFTGQTSGYQYQGYAVLFVPVAVLLLSSSRIQRFLGWLGAAAFIILSMPNGWSRFVIVSMILVLSLVDTHRRSARWPRLMLAASFVLSASILQLRSHTDWELTSLASEVSALARELPFSVSSVIGGNDAGMLATLYLESFVKDHITGFDYGIPFVNYAISGWIPYRFFPQKYFLLDWLRKFQPSITSPTIKGLLHGAKSTLFGDLYANGGMIAVAFGSLLLGSLSKKLDGMVMQASPLVVKAVGISWMSVLWMIWGSSATWALSTLGFLFLPAIPIWLVTRKETKQPGSSQVDRFGTFRRNPVG